MKKLYTTLLFTTLFLITNAQDCFVDLVISQPLNGGFVTIETDDGATDYTADATIDIIGEFSVCINGTPPVGATIEVNLTYANISFEPFICDGSTYNCEYMLISTYNGIQDFYENPEDCSISGDCEELEGYQCDDNDPTTIFDNFQECVCEGLADTDGDGVQDNDDNCLTIPNPDQSDTDFDQVGNVCDNCPVNQNQDQTDTDGDLIGDVCDICPTDPLNDCLLPVELEYFSGELTEQGAYLIWQTVNEDNSDFFVIEHSLDAKEWTAKGSVEAAGFTDFKTSYEYMVDIEHDINFFRLRIIDKDLSETFSGIIVLTSEDSLNDSFNIYPNPVKGTLYLNKENQYQIYNAQGTLKIEGQGMFVDVKKLPIGVYYIRLSNKVFMFEKI